MELNYIKMTNFRQYYGEHYLEFARGDKNVTLIKGANNTGKTGIYRALIFSLYGDKSLPQDKEANINLVNFDAIDDFGIAEAESEVSLNHEGKKYTIRRTIKANNASGKYTMNRSDELFLSYVDENGDYHSFDNVDRIEAQEKIDEILSPSIKEFFLFDGEKIETLTRRDKESKREVKNGIIKLMQIDKKERLSSIFNSMDKNQLKELRKQGSNLNTQKYEKELEKIKDEIARKEELKKSKKENIQNMEHSLFEIEEEMKGTEELSEYLSKLKESETELEHKKELYKSNVETMTKFQVSGLATLIMEDYIKLIDEDMSKLLLSRDDSIPYDLIKSAVDNQICSTCRQDVQGDSLRILEEILENYKPNFETKLINDLSTNSKKELAKTNKYSKDLEESILKSSKLEEEIEEIEYKIQKLEEAISEFNISQKDLSSKERRRQELYISIEADNRDINKYNDELKELNSEETIINEKLEEEYKKDSALSYQNKRYQFIKNINSKLKSVVKDYETNTREKLGKETTKQFNRLIDNMNLTLVDKVVINDRYELELFEGETNISGDISQGQQLMVALSFITSLASLASNSIEQVDYPLFMDTPFAKLSQKNRKNLIENLPLVTKQWIPLVTDSEHTEYEAGIFESTGRVGKEYRIEKIDSRKSRLIQV